MCNRSHPGGKIGLQLYSTHTLVIRFLILLCALCWPAFCQEPKGDLLIQDFEGEGWGEWKVTGEAFGPGPARGTLPGQMQVDGFKG